MESTDPRRLFEGKQFNMTFSGRIHKKPIIEWAAGWLGFYLPHLVAIVFFRFYLTNKYDYNSRN
jgi:hypothetical protein